MARPRIAATDAAIIDAALQMVAHHGLAATSVQRIAKEAGVNRPALYRRYRRKHDLVGPCIARLEKRLRPAVRSATPAEFERRVADALFRSDLLGWFGDCLSERQDTSTLALYRRQILEPIVDRASELLGDREGALALVGRLILAEVRNRSSKDQGKGRG